MHPPRKLEVCLKCGSDKVVPTHFEETEDEQWKMELYCGECEHRSKGVFSQSMAKRYEDQLDKAHEEISADLEKLAEIDPAELASSISS